MNRNNLDTAIAEAERFLVRAKALAELDDRQLAVRAVQERDSDAGKTVWNWTLRTLEFGGRESGDVRRSSMDLTRALSDLRRRD